MSIFVIDGQVKMNVILLAWFSIHFLEFKFLVIS